MKKIIPVNTFEDFAKIMNNNTDCVVRSFRRQSRFNGLVVLFAASMSFWACAEAAHVAVQQGKIKELEKRIAELEPKEGEKGQE